jgi:hypothetical protein
MQVHRFPLRSEVDKVLDAYDLLVIDEPAGVHSFVDTPIETRE